MMFFVGFFFNNPVFTFLILSSLSEALPMIKERAVEVGHVLFGCLEVIPVSPFGAIGLTGPAFIHPRTGCSGLGGRGSRR